MTPLAILPGMGYDSFIHCLPAKDTQLHEALSHAFCGVTRPQRRQAQSAVERAFLRSGLALWTTWGASRCRTWHTRLAGFWRDVVAQWGSVQGRPKDHKTGAFESTCSMPRCHGSGKQRSWLTFIGLALLRPSTIHQEAELWNT